MRLEQKKIGKNLSFTEWRKSCLDSLRLKQNETKGMLNEMRL